MGWRTQKVSTTEGWLFSSPPWLYLNFISLLKPLLPAALLGSKAAAEDGELLPMPEARRRDGEAAAVPLGSRKIPPCLCSRDQEVDTSPGHSTHTSSALANTLTGTSNAATCNPKSRLGLPAAATIVAER